MRLSILLSGFTLGAVVALSAGTALAAKKGHAHAPAAEDDDYPLSYAQRPLTLPRLTLAPELDFAAVRVAFGTAAQVATGINLGASFGITKDLEVGALFLPLQFSPSFGYGSSGGYAGNLQIFGTYRFLDKKELEIGARLRSFIITQGGTAALIEPSVPLLFRLTKQLRLDAEVGVPITLGGVGVGAGAKKATYVGLDVPLALSFNVIEPLHIGVRSGVNMFDLGHPKQFATVPLGFFVGFAVGGKRPIVDLDPYFTWTQFLTPGGTDKVNAGYFTAGLNVRGYIFL